MRTDVVVLPAPVFDDHACFGQRVEELTVEAHEQSGYVISGAYKLTFGGAEYFLREGDSYSIPANVEHSIEIIEAGQVVDVFTPIRADYL